MNAETLLAILADYGLWLLIPVSIIEGPIVSVLAGWAVSLDAMNLVLAYTVLVLGDVIGDCILYAIGRQGAQGIQRWLPRRFQPSPRTMAPLVRGFRNNGFRVLVAGKLTHAAGMAVLLAAGVAKVPIAQFIAANLVASVPKTAALMALGWGFGEAHERIGEWMSFGSQILLGLIVIAGIIWFMLRRRKAND